MNNFKTQLDFLKNAYVAKKLYEKYCNEAEKKYDLNNCDGEVLLHLRISGGEGLARDIVESNWISKSQVSKSVEKLTKAGYISSWNDAADRRLVHLKLTEAAEATVKDIENATEKFLDRLFSGMEQDEIYRLNLLMEKMAENVKKGE